jgi:hypothetical protein
MGFQIRDKDGNAIAINKLDEEACAFWNIPVDKEAYAKAWFDMIGYKIHHPIDPNYTSGWGNVKHNMLLVTVGSLYKTVNDEKAFHEEVEQDRLWLKKYFDLIDHWEAKGYTPHKVEG